MNAATEVEVEVGPVEQSCYYGVCWALSLIQNAATDLLGISTRSIRRVHTHVCSLHQRHRTRHADRLIPLGVPALEATFGDLLAGDKRLVDAHRILVWRTSGPDWGTLPDEVFEENAPQVEVEQAKRFPLQPCFLTSFAERFSLAGATQRIDQVSYMRGTTQCSINSGSPCGSKSNCNTVRNKT